MTPSFSIDFPKTDPESLAEPVECSDDDDAIDKARQYADGRDIEVWDSMRRAAQIGARAGRSLMQRAFEMAPRPARLQRMPANLRSAEWTRADNNKEDGKRCSTRHPQKLAGFFLITGV